MSLAKVKNEGVAELKNEGIAWEGLQTVANISKLNEVHGRVIKH